MAKKSKGKKGKKGKKKGSKKREKLEEIKSEDDEETQKKKQSLHFSWSLLWQALAVTCLAVNLTSVGLRLHMATYAAGFTAAVASVIVFIRQFQLRDADGGSRCVPHP